MTWQVEQAQEPPQAPELPSEWDFRKVKCKSVYLPSLSPQIGQYLAGCLLEQPHMYAHRPPYRRM